MQIKDIYSKYKVPPNLQLHMYRVAAFAKLIIHNWKGDNVINEDIIVTACLLHDLGSIIKFDFDNFPELLGDEVANIEYWRNIKKEMIERYGNKEDIATLKMLKEINISEEILSLVENWGFKNFTRIAESNNWNWKIAVYADHRIGPTGVVSLRENLENKQRRYKLNKPDASHVSDQAESLFRSAQEVEKQIEKNVKIDLKQITTEMVDNIIDEFKQ